MRMHVYVCTHVWVYVHARVFVLLMIITQYCMVMIFRYIFKKDGVQGGRASLIEAENNENSESYQTLGPPSKKKLLIFKNCKECFFIVLRFLATIALVPLVYMQTLDVYEWICIRGEEFCGTPEKQTNLSIYKTAITLTFVLSAFIISSVNLESKE